MKLKHLLFLLAFTPIVVSAQGNLHSIGGTSVTGYTGDGGNAQLAQLDSPSRTRVDADGNVYFIQRNQHVVRKISTTGIITTVAGTGVAGYNGDNIPANTATLNDPGDIVIDRFGNLYIADRLNHRVRRVDKFTGLIETVAGDGQNINSGDGGPAITASLDSPQALAIDKYDTLYVASGLAIRKFYVSGDILIDYYTSHRPQTICFDSTGNMYYSINNQIWRENVSDDLLSLVGGTSATGTAITEGMQAYDAEIEVTDLVVTADSSVYISSRANNRIYRISADLRIYTVAGNGNSTAENVAPLTAGVLAPMGIGLDTCDNIYFAEAGNHKVRAITYMECSPLAVHNIEPISYSLYPNPASVSFVIEAVTAIKDVTIINSTGQTVLSMKANGNRAEINTASLARGLYFVKVVDRNGAQRTEKLTIN